MDMKNLEKLNDAENDGVVTVIYQRNGEPYQASDGTESTMTIVGSESKKVKAAKASQTRTMLNKRRTKLTPEDVEENLISQAAAAVIDWHGWELDGKPAKLNKENLAAVLKYDHIREQVEQVRDAHADFSGKR
jgi:hypothetical protein